MHVVTAIMALLLALGGVSAGEVPAVVAADQAALEASGLPPEESLVDEVDQYWWPNTRLFEVVNGLNRRMVAVDAEGLTYSLTGGILLDVEQLTPGRLYTEAELTTSTKAAIDDFNRLAVVEGVQLAGEEEVEWYLEFFLAVHVRKSGAYLPGRRVADAIAALQFYSDESEQLCDAFKQITQPVVLVHRLAEGFEGRSYDWRWWSGVIDEYILTVSPAGRVTFAQSRYADQPPSS